MKMRKLTLCLLALVLAVSFCVPVLAAGNGQAKLDYVTDLYGILSAEDAAYLESNAEALSNRFGCGIYILVVKDYRDYANNTFQFAQDVYEEYNLGLGSEKTGVLLMLSMADRDYELLFHGDSTDVIFTEYGRNLIEEAMLDSFRNNDFAGGFLAYQQKTAELLQAAADGKPVDQPKRMSLLFLLPGLISSVLTGGIMSSSMKSTGLKRDANDYMVQGRVNLTHQSDIFLRRTVSRRAKETKRSSGSSGSSHHSGDYSGRSGKF